MREPCFGLFAWAVRKEAAEALLANAFPIGGQAGGELTPLEFGGRLGRITICGQLVPQAG